MIKKIGVIGLGYVGLPLAIASSKKYLVVGYDTNLSRIKLLKKKIDFNNEFSKKDLSKIKNINFTNKVNELENCKIKIITVPTPIKKNKKPDLSLIKEATRNIAKYTKKGDIIVYESTVYPGVTDDICIPIIEKISKLKINKEFYCGYSPERINPGDKNHKITNIVKITSGSNKYSLNIIDKFYKSIINAKTFKANSIKEAEAAKVIENAQRDINIAFINEVTQIFSKLNLNTYNILKAASTKWNFLNFKPGLVGGHCIGVDPYYLSYLAKTIKITPQIILSGRNINDNMSIFIANKIINEIKKYKNLKKSKVLIMGLSFKEDCSDFRNTKVLDLFLYMKKKVKLVDIFDPVVDAKKVKKELNINVLNKLNYSSQYDAICILVKHKFFIKIGYKKIFKLGNKNCVYFDLKNIFKHKKFINI